MKKILFTVLITLATVLIFRACSEGGKERAVLEESSMLIQQQIDNVSKLIVTEGHFAEVYNYKDSQQLFGDLITADKKALVVVNAEVAIAYDLSNTNLTIKLVTENEVAFLYYAAVIDLHSRSYGNYKQENSTKNERV